MMNGNDEIITEITEKEQNQYSIKELITLNIIKKIKYPYKNLTVNDVAKDLNIGINTAYDIFKRDDFPSIEIGKQKTITLLAYLLWKLEKHK